MELEKIIRETILYGKRIKENSRRNRRDLKFIPIKLEKYAHGYFRWFESSLSMLYEGILDQENVPVGFLWQNVDDVQDYGLSSVKKWLILNPFVFLKNMGISLNISLGSTSLRDIVIKNGIILSVRHLLRNSTANDENEYIYEDAEYQSCVCIEYNMLKDRDDIFGDMFKDESMKIGMVTVDEEFNVIATSKLGNRVMEKLEDYIIAINRRMEDRREEILEDGALQKEMRLLRKFKLVPIDDDTDISTKS